MSLDELYSQLIQVGPRIGLHYDPQYFEAFRSNYFAVKDSKAFANFCAEWGVEMIETTRRDGQRLYGCCSSDGIPMECRSEKPSDGEDGNSRDFFDVLAEHLADGWVAVCQVSGNAETVAVHGYAVAINSTGEAAEVSLHDIYSLAKKLGEHITACEDCWTTRQEQAGAQT